MCRVARVDHQKTGERIGGVDERPGDRDTVERDGGRRIDPQEHRRPRVGHVDHHEPPFTIGDIGAACIDFHVARGPLSVVDPGLPGIRGVRHVDDHETLGRVGDVGVRPGQHDCLRIEERVEGPDPQRCGRMRDVDDVHPADEGVRVEERNVGETTRDLHPHAAVAGLERADHRRGGRVGEIEELDAPELGSVAVEGDAGRRSGRLHEARSFGHDVAAREKRTAVRQGDRRPAQEPVPRQGDLGGCVRRAVGRACRDDRGRRGPGSVDRLTGRARARSWRLPPGHHRGRQDRQPRRAPTPTHRVAAPSRIERTARHPIPSTHS